MVLCSYLQKSGLRALPARSGLGRGECGLVNPLARRNVAQAVGGKEPIAPFKENPNLWWFSPIISHSFLGGKSGREVEAVDPTRLKEKGSVGPRWECGEKEISFLRSVNIFCKGPNGNILVFGGHSWLYVAYSSCLLASQPFKNASTVLSWWLVQEQDIG